MGFSASKSKQSSQQQSQSTSQSFNQAFPYLQSTYSPVVAQGNSASNAIASLLGLNGESAQTEGFDTFRNSSGYNFIKDQGIRGIEAGNASKGLLGSGATLKAITSYSSDLARSFLDSYLANLGGLSGSGLSAGQIINSAGNTANSQSTSSGTSKGSSFGLSLGLKGG